MINFENAKEKHGSVVFEGAEYALIEQASLTSRLMPNAPYHEAKAGEEYSFELAADAIDVNGNEYLVTWHFINTKGDEKELDEFDYDHVHNVTKK